MAQKRMTDAQMIRELQAVFESTFGEKLDKHGEDLASLGSDVKGLYREFKRMNGSVRENSKSIGELKVQSAVQATKLITASSVIAIIVTAAVNNLF